MRRLLLALVSAWTLVPSLATATVLLPIEFRELVSVADVIVHGRVATVATEWTEGRRSIETLVTINARDYLKGDAGSTITIHVPGGQLGRYRTVLVGAPEFTVNDEVVLFLRAGRIVGLSQGAFRVVTDPASGRPALASPIVTSSSLGQPESVVRGDVRRKPVPLDSLRGLVQQLLAGGPR
jgi:hypothetical protein